MIENYVETAVREAVQRRADVIEAACERMLTTPGDHGVLVHEWQDLDLDKGSAHMYVQAGLSTNVPAMTVETHLNNPARCELCATLAYDSEGRSP